MNEEGAVTRLLDLIQTIKEQDVGLHQMLMELFYEMSRIQRIRHQELGKRSKYRIFQAHS
jgi:hypothetical protein